MADLIQQLESNDTRIAEEMKEKFHEHFKSVQDNWLLYSIYDYYMVTNSARSIEIMVNVKEPHYNYLFNKLSDTIKGSKSEQKVQALTLLGHILRKEPFWLYKITEHHLLKDLLKLLKTESDILLLLSALLALVVLLPTVPSRMGQYLQEVFEIFSRLAAWNCSNPEKLVEEQMIHMQVALYALFQRLYGMYPCNFLAYLRNQYRSKEQIPIFVHTVKPMLDTVKMHPLLVTASKDKETTTERWKKMGSHDVVVECERFSLDVAERCQHDSCYLTSSFRSRSGTTNSTTYAESTNQLPNIKSTSIASIAYDAKDFFSPSMKLYPKSPPVQDSTIITTIPQVQNIAPALIGNVSTSQEGTSPPEAAIEATPETTPIKDLGASRGQLPHASTAVRALSNLGSRNWSIGSTSSTPGHSQPSSPMRKDVSPFSFPTETRLSAFGVPKKETYTSQKIQKLVQDRAYAIEGETARSPVIYPTSPLRVIAMNDCNNVLGSIQRIESPVSREDEEVLEIVRRGVMDGDADLRQCDSVLQEGEGGRGTEVDLEECEQDHGSPCTAGGLHMPNSRSMNDFAKRVRRLRYHSQCATEPEVAEASTGSSPGKCEPFLSNTVRRANSCPEIKKEMKKSPLVPTKDNINKPLVEADEDVKDGEVKHTQKNLSTTETQTENFWPMPYEHLFLGIFPSLDACDIKPSPAPSPAPLNVQDKFSTVSPYEILDKYIDIAGRVNERDSIKTTRDQLSLLHQQLLFERHRREIHALKNRRLLADAKNTKALEEHNSALRDQVQLQQKVIDNLKEQLESSKSELHYKLRHGLETAHIWEEKYISMQEENRLLNQQIENEQKASDNLKSDITQLNKLWQQSQSSLLDAEAEVKIAKEQAWAGENIKAELESVSKQLLLSGEMQHRYQEKLAQLPLLQRFEHEYLRSTDTYTNEIKNLQQLVETKTTLLEAARSRIGELEQLLCHCDESTVRQKRLLSEVAEEYEEKLKALESKYLTQLTISRVNDERILELWQRIELLIRHPVHSPDTSSCHEVHATITDKTSIATGLSPHSSPLSTSLASSEGSVAFGHSDMKNLQNLLDQKETLSPTSKAAEELDVTLLGAVSVPQPSSSSSIKQD
ncbi:hypothetical protein PPYR_11117 [Photinus pyralis]|uniref:Hamartin n=1 Tax=Photinus pyralis TaxID=7054 RepID=A0A5N4AIF0_PHOPY|nr:hamartin [Photinus pyralis]KAB0797056.1 hypothetical protein PPYR_11117 [Photinus pyralis]